MSVNGRLFNKDDADSDSNDHDSGAAYVFDIDLMPTAVNDSVSVNEDSSISIDVIQNDLDEDGGVNSLLSVTQPNFGSTSIISNEVLYQPNLNYCNESLTYDEFTYELNGGSQGIVSAEVICMNAPHRLKFWVM